MKNKWLTLAASLGVAGLTQVANANITWTSITGPGLFLQDSANPSADAYVALDASGDAQFNGSVGDWSVAVTSGVTINGGVNPAIDLNIDQATKGSGAGTLSVYFVNGLFGPSAGTWSLAVSQGGTIPSGIISTAYDSIGAGSLPGGLTALGTLSSGNSVGGSLNSGESQYYLAIGDAITSSQTSVDIGLSVPDGGSTAAMLGLALCGLGLVVRKVRRA